MEEAERLRARARHCRILAEATSDDDTRNTLLRIADERDAAAEGVEARHHKGVKRDLSLFSRLRAFFRKQ